jgi:hypothetical protein
MLKNIPADKMKRLQKRFGCAPTWSKSDLCSPSDKDVCRVRKKGAIAAQQRARPITRDTIQDLEINGLKHEISELRCLLEMLMVLVDPEDVKAAYELPKITPSHETLCDIADQSELPPELFDD